ncbi:LOW QUALITY PROTEIN: probable E3 ubiquitin-protein ligase XERICO [Musa acuminata AAA Group]|uniref:LOW QUALITY PROTEIN: probable E3 ubiquitin-protein ligase XERICO n=1 Tax=Musa acuminata AAA Group TaxID=214697 RepID=UPI0031E46BEB
MGLSSLPTPSESVLTLVLVNTAITVSILKELLRSALHLLRLRATPRPQPALASPGPPEPSLADRFRSQSSPMRFGSALGLRRHASADCRVCLARFDAESVVNRLPCGHLFHAGCLETWLDYRHTTCPLCRTHVLQEERPPSPPRPFCLGFSSASLVWRPLKTSSPLLIFCFPFPFSL